MCATEAARRGRSVLVIDHSGKLGGKILISGGGRCNFTNVGASAVNYVSQNPHFSKSALSRFTPEAFIERVRAHEIPFHEKKLGQLFCDRSAQDIVSLLKKDAEEAGVHVRLQCEIKGVSQRSRTTHDPLPNENPRFQVETHQGSFDCESVVVATGGLSIPKLGATGIGYSIARSFGLKIIPTAPALDGFTFSTKDLGEFHDLAGVSCDVVLSARDKKFRENILFTHAGLSGPAALQVSLHWFSGDPVFIDFLPGIDLFSKIMSEKKTGNRSILRSLVAESLPSRLAERLTEVEFPNEQERSLPLPQLSEKRLESFCQKLHAWPLHPSGTVGYNKAEVTRGGVDTDELSSKTMEVKKIPGLYFIGEVVDVTGWLGGYNFQWAWASGWAAGQNV